MSTFKNMFGYKTYDGKPYDGKCSFFDLSDPPLPTGVGWVICVALGCFFAALVSVMMYVSNRNVSASEQTGNNSEVYSTPLACCETCWHACGVRGDAACLLVLTVSLCARCTAPPVAPSPRA